MTDDGNGTPQAVISLSVEHSLIPSAGAEGPDDIACHIGTSTIEAISIDVDQSAPNIVLAPWSLDEIKASRLLSSGFDGNQL